MKNHWFLTPVFAQIDGYVSLRQNGPSNYTSDRSSKRPVATGLGLVFQISQNPGNHNRTNHQRAWTATAVRSFFGPVQFGLRSFCGPRTGLLNTSFNVVHYWEINLFNIRRCWVTGSRGSLLFQWVWSWFLNVLIWFLFTWGLLSLALLQLPLGALCLCSFWWARLHYFFLTVGSLQ